MYTIGEERKETRKRLYELIQDRFNLREVDKLNESAYHIHSKEINSIVTTINEIIKQIQKERLNFGSDDFIDIYYAAHLKSETYKENLEDIIRYRVYPHEYL